MSTPASQIPDFDTFVRERGGGSPARPPRTRPPAPQVPDFDTFKASRPARTAAPNVSLPPVDAGLDSFVQNVIGEASKRTGYSYKLGEGSRTPEQQAGKVARGVSWTYNSAHMHGRGRDVLAYDSAGNYITDGAHEAYKALGDVYSELAPSSPVRVKWGVVRDGRQVDPGHFQLEDDGDAPAGVPDFDEFKASRGVPDFDEFVAERRASDPVDPVTGESESEIRAGAVNARRPDAPPPPSPRTLPPLPEPKPLNAQTAQGRATRDAYESASWASNAKLPLDVPLPAGASDWSQVTSEQASAQAARTFAERRGIPSEFVEKWLEKNKHLSLHLYDAGTGERREPSDYIYEGSPAYDFERRTLRVSAEMPHLKQLEQDYEASKGVAQGLGDFVADETRSPYEKLRAVTWDSPQARDARAAVDYGLRGAKALDAGTWAAMLDGKPGSVTPTAAAIKSFMGEPTPYDNPVGDAWRAGVEGAASYVEPSPGGSGLVDAARASLASQMRDSAGVGQSILGVVAQPLNLVPVGEAGALLRAGKLGRAVSEGGELSARVAKALRPLGLEAPERAAARDALEVVMRGSDGTNYLVHTGTGDVVNLETGELVELARSPHEVLESAGYRVTRTAAPNRTAAGDAPEVWKVTGPDGNAQIIRDDAELADLADSVAPALLGAAASQRGGAVRRPARAFGVVCQNARAVIEGRNPDEAIAEARRAGLLPTPAKSTDANNVLDLIGLPKAFMASADLSAPGRQGIVFLVTKPVRSMQAGADMLAAISKVGHERVLGELAAHPKFKLAEDSGLYLANFAGGEEVFGGAIARRIPGVRVSDRTFETFLDSQRLRVFSDFADQMIADGITDPAEFKSLASWVNKATGRGDLGRLDKFSRAGNALMFSPKLAASRLQILSPTTYMNMTPAARKIAVRKMLQFTGTLGGALFAAKVAGADVQLNPFRSGFGQITFGKTHLDLSGGHAYSVHAAARLASTLYKLAAGERWYGKGEPPKTLVDRVSRFLQSSGLANFGRSKLSPAASLGVDYMTGETMEGEKFSWKGAAYHRLVPLFAQDLLEGMREEGWWGAAKATPSFFGVGVNSYDSRQRRRGSGGGEPREPDGDAPQGNYLRLEGERESGNVDDRRDPDLVSGAHYTAEDHAALVSERREAGAPEIDDAQAGAIALAVDGMKPEEFQRYAKTLDEAHQLGLVGETVARAPELASKALSRSGLVEEPERYAQASDAARFLRMIAREKRLRPTQFYYDAAAGRYGERLRDEALEGVYYPENHPPGLPLKKPAPVPESPETLREQFKSSESEESPRVGVLVTPGEESPDVPRGFARVSLDDGALYLNRRKLRMMGLGSRASVRDFIARNGFEPLIGKVAPVADTSKGMALRTEDARGVELSSSIVPTREAAEAQAAVDRAHFPQAARHELGTAQEAVARRRAEAAPKAGDSYRSRKTGDVLEVRNVTGRGVFLGARGGEGDATARVERDRFNDEFEKAAHKFSSTQVDLLETAAREVKEVGRRLIPDSAVYTDPKDDSLGREQSPHVTVKYGIHTEDAEEVRRVLAGSRPVTVTLGKVSIFRAKGETPYDVVKVDVDSPGLHRLNAKLARALKVTDTHKDYKPHVTLAYVKKGEGKRFVGDKSLEGKRLTFDALTFSSSAGETARVRLGGRGQNVLAQS